MMSGSKHTEESKQRISQKLKGRVSNRKGVKHSPETCMKIGLSKIGNTNRLGIPFTEEAKKKISIAVNKWIEENPEQAIVRAAHLVTLMKSPEGKKANSEKQKKRHADNPELGKQHSEFLKEYYNQHPELCEKARDKTIVQFSDPTARENARIRQLKFLEEHPEFPIEQGKRIKDYYKNHPEAIEKMSIDRFGKYRGENNPCWKGGRTELRMQIRQSTVLKRWRSLVFERDGYTCQNPHCGHKTRTIHAHHITPFSQILDKYNIATLEEAEACRELWDVNNGITLCVYCHYDGTNHKAVNYKKTKKVSGDVSV